MNIVTSAERHTLNPRMLILRGVLAIIFGLMVVAWPGPSLLAIAFLYGAYAFADGILAIATGIRRGRNRQSWSLPILEGILGIGIGIMTLFWPAVTLYVLSVLIGAWAVLTGLLEVAAAFKLQQVRPGVSTAGRILLGVAGVLSIALGMVIFYSPGIGMATLLTFVASYALIFGGLLVGLGIRLRRLGDRPSVHQVGKAA